MSNQTDTSAARERRFKEFDAWVEALPPGLRSDLSERQRGTKNWHLITMRVRRSPGQYCENTSAVHRVADVPPGWARAAGRPF